MGPTQTLPSRWFIRPMHWTPDHRDHIAAVQSVAQSLPPTGKTPASSCRTASRPRLTKACAPCRNDAVGRWRSSWRRREELGTIAFGHGIGRVCVMPGVTSCRPRDLAKRRASPAMNDAAAKQAAFPDPRTHCQCAAREAPADRRSHPSSCHGRGSVQGEAALPKHRVQQFRIQWY